MKNYTKLLLTTCLLRAGVAFAQEKPEPQFPRALSNIVRQVEEAWDKAPSWFVAVTAGSLGGSLFGKAGMIDVKVRAESAGAVIAMGVAKIMESQRNPLEARVTVLEKDAVRIEGEQNEQK